jgi:hypothetical protein
MGVAPLFLAVERRSSPEGERCLPDEGPDGVGDGPG